MKMKGAQSLHLSIALVLLLLAVELPCKAQSFKGNLTVVVVEHNNREADFEAQFSTWESASAHRILAGNDPSPIHVSKALNPYNAACNARFSSSCLPNHPANPISDLRRCVSYKRCRGGS